MPRSFRLVSVAVAFCLCACHRAPDTDTTTPPAPDDASAASPSAPSAAPSPGDATAPASTAPGSDYACADGTRLRVDFGAHDATLRWPDGRTLVLPRAESASKGGGDAYVGETVSLQRGGTGLQLHDGDRAATTCTPGGAATPNAAAAAAAADDRAAGDTAIAARYACDADTVLTRNEDGSFRAEVPGNPPVRLARIAGSTPPVFTGASLYLRIGDGGEAILSQGDRADELHCRAG